MRFVYMILFALSMHSVWASDYTYTLNLVPIANPGTSQTVRSGDTVQLIGQASDPDGSVASTFWRQLTGPAVSISSPSSLNASFTAPQVTGGTTEKIKIQLEVFDTLGASTTSSLLLYVQNSGITFPAIGNKSINENQALAFTLSASDVSGNPVSYGVDNLPLGASFDATSGVFNWTPDYEQSGNYAVTFFAHAISGLSESQTINISVININRAPIVDAVTSVNSAEFSNVQFTVSASDLDGQVTSLSLYSGPAGASFSNGSFSWTPGVNDAGVYDVIFVASDGVTETYHTVTVSIANVNQAPQIDMGASLFVPDWQTISLNPQVEDIDGSIASVKWRQISGPTLNFSSTTSISTSVVTPDIPAATTSADAIVELSATDNEGLVSTAQLQITIYHENQLPEVNVVLSQTVVASGDVILATVNASDVDGQIVDYLWMHQAGPSVLFSNPNAPQTQISIPFIAAGEVIRLRLAVGDNESGVTLVDVQLTTPPPAYTQNSGEFARAFGLNANTIYTMVVGATADAQNNSFMFGNFYGSEDFDFGPGEDIRVGNSYNQSGFITKISERGTYEWTWVAYSSAGMFRPFYLNKAVADAAGNVYATGYFKSYADFGAGNVTGTAEAMFIVKISPQGSLLWQRFIDGSGNDRGIAIDVDANANVYVLGEHGSVSIDFDPTEGSDVRNRTSYQDLFVTKLNSSGDYLWTSRVGNSIAETYGYFYGYDLTVDNNGAVYASGRAYASVGETMRFAIDQANQDVEVLNSNDGYLFKLDTSGALQWVWRASQAGTASFVRGLADYNNELSILFAYNRGTVDTDPLGSGAAVSTYANNTYRVVSLSSDGKQTYLSDAFNFAPFAIDYDPQGNFYISGGSSGGDFDLSGGSDYQYGKGGLDIYVTKLDAAKNYQWTYLVGGTGSDVAKGLATLPNGSVWVMGSFYNGSVDFSNGLGHTAKTASGTHLFAMMLTGDPTTHRDIDGDTIADALETLVGMNPSDAADALGDIDGDGVNNLDEYRNGSLGGN
ncbi:MAG: putative Ig domain-containing protein [Gammaproteobacteria bacterium]|nr:putative Ig domain-containing protein [Gammaproteobacteria bacterium]MDH5729080.1 putative Ig domain-containing protein [Gammaproteobacteria bacterium]